MPEIKRPPHTYAGELLRTKLQPPPVETTPPLPDRLLTRLEAGKHGRLTVIAAPAGYGKTTLAAGWVARQEQPAAWLSLEPADSDPTRFWRYVIEACQVFDEDIRREIVPALGAVQHDSFEPFLVAFLNRLAEIPAQRLLVLDDYHVIDSEAIHQSLAYLLNHLPHTLHLVLLTRGEPPLPLGHLRVRDELNELRDDDLCLSAIEIDRYLQRKTGLSFSQDEIARILMRTEGWGAGVQLIAHALEGRQEPDAVQQVLKTFRGDHRYFAEYVVENVLADQPDAVQEFALKTGFLTRLTPSLCAAVTGCEDSAIVLETLSRSGLFLTRIGAGQATWYRYHPLIGEALAGEAKRRWDEETPRNLLSQASIWYEDHGLLPEAIETAFQASDSHRAAELMAQLVETRGLSELHTFRRWAEMLPQALLAAYPALAFYAAYALLYTSDRRASATVERVENPLRLAEEGWLREGNEAGWGQVLAFRATVAMWQGHRRDAFAFARQARQHLPESGSEWVGICLLFVSQEALMNGHTDRALRTVLEAQAICEAHQNPHGALAARVIHADVCFRQGQLQQAAHLYRQALRQSEQEDDPSDRIFSLIGLGRLHYEWNDLEEAETCAREAQMYAKQVNDDYLTLQASILLARVLAALDSYSECREQLTALVTLSSWRDLRREAEVWAARLALAHGDLPVTRQWVDAYDTRESGLAPSALQELEDHTAVRWHIRQGDGKTALQKVASWRDHAAAGERVRGLLEARILEALARFVSEDEEAALNALRPALETARTDDYCRLFIDEGEGMAALLRAYVDAGDWPFASYARLLLQHFMHEPALGSSDLASLPIEPLSDHERHVLRLLVAGLSYREIAEERVVSVNTVKTQVKSIYSKLGVHSRDEARTAANDLSLL